MHRDDRTWLAADREQLRLAWHPTAAKRAAAEAAAREWHRQLGVS